LFGSGILSSHTDRVIQRLEQEIDRLPKSSSVGEADSLADITASDR
jgi:hypothetical protein